MVMPNVYMLTVLCFNSYVEFEFFLFFLQNGNKYCDVLKSFVGFVRYRHELFYGKKIYD